MLEHLPVDGNCEEGFRMEFFEKGRERQKKKQDKRKERKGKGEGKRKMEPEHSFFFFFFLRRKKAFKKTLCWYLPKNTLHKKI